MCVLWNILLDMSLNNVLVSNKISDRTDKSGVLPIGNSRTLETEKNR